MNVGQFTPDGLFLPPIDLLPVLNTNLVLTVSLVAQPAVRAQLVIPPQFACAQYLNLSGRSGALGCPGMHGGPGEPGPAVHVAVGYLTRTGKPPLVLVRVEDSQGIRARTVLAADAPPLQIFLDGGTGGQGGPPEVVRNNLGYAMAQVSGGVGGDGGDGGAAEIDYDAASPELERRVIVLNRGGPGGYGEGMAGRAGRPGAIPRKEPVRVDELFRDEIAHGVPIRRPNGLERTSNKQAI